MRASRAALRWLVVHPRLDWINNMRITLYNMVRLMWQMNKEVDDSVVADTEMQAPLPALDMDACTRCLQHHIRYAAVDLCQV